jgi:hypothetical protein
MSFHAISRDESFEPSEDGPTPLIQCKRRKLQNSCFQSQFNSDSVSEENHPFNEELLKRKSSFTCSDLPQCQALSRQLQSDLTAFIESAKEMFTAHNMHLFEFFVTEHGDITSAAFIQKEMEFVSQAIVIYLQEFIPSSTYLELLETASHITAAAFYQNIDADAINSDTSNRHFSVISESPTDISERSVSFLNPSPISRPMSSLGYMAIVDDLSELNFHNNLEKVSAISSPTSQMSQKTVIDRRDFEFDDCHGAILSP